MENNQEQKAPESEIKEVAVASGARHIGKASLKKGKSFEDIAKKKLMSDLKLWSDDVLKAQVESKKCADDFKKACAEELAAREEARAKKAKK